MKLWFLGGANEVGASCTLMEVAGKRILIDAGVRMQGSDRLPNLSMIDEVGPLDAILVTHAHTDHIGALPQVHAMNPAVPILTTEPSKALMKILLFDGLRIMESRWGAEAEIPLYSEEQVTSMLGRLRTVPPGEAISLCDGQISATFTPSGHILGCCSILFQTLEGTVLFTGDYSVDAQRTVEGMFVPRCRPDLVITESTYGNRSHASREAEEQRLADSVAEVIEGGGKVLIPAFALGRAQEVILILLDAQQRGKIPAVPIYVDGMVRGICGVYADYPQFLASKLRRQVLKFGNPFFPVGGSAKMVVAPEREKILKGGPCAIVTSSGMLTGGPSQYYAAELASGKENAIFITGYQDEESPGRRILDVAEGKESTLRLGGNSVTVECRVGKYNLSAHADALQMVGVLSRLKPRHVCLVHGDDGARQRLAETIPKEMQVHLVNNGECFDLQDGQPARHSVRRGPGLAPTEPFSIAQARAHLLFGRGGGRLMTAQELAELWFGGETTAEQVQQVREQLDGSKSGIVPDRRRPYLYRIQEDEKGASSAAGPKRRADGRMEQNEAMALAGELFADDPSMYKKGVAIDSGELLLSFHFPDVAREQHRERLAELQRQTGWKVKLSSGVNQAALLQVAERIVSQQRWALARTPSVHWGEKVVLKLASFDGLEPTLARELSERFQAQTGYALELEKSAGAAPVAVSSRPDGRVEQNAAFTLIREAFAQTGVAVQRASLKPDPERGGMGIEVALISPQVAARYQALLERLEERTRWPLRFASEPNQDLIKRRARELMPPEWGLRKEPGFFKGEGMVKVKLDNPPTTEELSRVSQLLEQATGYRLGLA